MAMASASTVALGSVAFGMFWVLAVFPAVPFLPIGRTAGSLLGAVLMVVFRVITPEQAYAAIDLPILGLLFGTMAVGGFLERADMFKHLGKLLSWRSRGGKDLLCRVCVVSAISSALFTNDTACVVLTEFILKIAKQDNLPPRIFLLALASSANIGSSATPIGNPQNLVIAIQGKISFGQFLIGILPAMIAGILVNAAILLLYFLAISPGENSAAAEGAVTEASAEDETASHRFSPATMSHVSPLNSPQRSPDADDGIQHSGNAEALRNGVVISESALTAVTVVSTMDQTNISPSPEEKESSAGRRKTLLWKLSVYLATLGMLISLLVGLDMSWTAITAALALMLLDFRDARPCLEKVEEHPSNLIQQTINFHERYFIRPCFVIQVSFSLLIFFCGMFITVDGFNKTGIPGALWDLMEPHTRIDRASGVIVLALAIIALSNIASNVPTVLLLGGRVAASASAISGGEETRAWLMLAWISTVAGNLSLLGSAANLIVCEQAGKAPSLAYNLSFWSHLRFGVPSTLLVTFVGLLLLWNY